MYNKMCFTEKGVKYTILFDFIDEETNRLFIVYTDYSIDECGKTRLFAALCQGDNTQLLLSPIVSKNDWRKVEYEIYRFLKNEN